MIFTPPESHSHQPSSTTRSATTAAECELPPARKEADGCATHLAAMNPDCDQPFGNFPSYLEDPTSVEGYNRTRSEARQKKDPLSRFYSRLSSNRSNTTSNQSSATGSQSAASNNQSTATQYPAVTWCSTCQYCYYCDPNPPDLRQHYRRCSHGSYMQEGMYGRNNHFCTQGRDEERRQQQESYAAEQRERLHQSAYSSAGYAGGRTQYTYQALSHPSQPHNQPQSHLSQASIPQQYYPPPSTQPAGHHHIPSWSQQPASSHDPYATTPSMGISQASTWNSNSSGYNDSRNPPPVPGNLPRSATWAGPADHCYSCGRLLQS